MKNFIKTAIIAASLLIGSFSVNAQDLVEETVVAKNKAFDHLSIGIDAGTYGPGISLVTTLTPNILLRGGFTYATADYKPDDMTWDVTGHVSQTTEDIDMVLKADKFSAEFVNFKLGFELYPMKNGIFSVGLGAYFGKSNIPIETTVKDYASKIAQYGEKPYFTFEDVVILPNNDGTMKGLIKFGNTVKPYFVLSLGRSIATNHRVSFKFDLGVIYQGQIKFESDNAKTGSDLIPKEADEYLDSPYLKFWPVLNFTLAYRIF
jgi:hypothetical protein